MTILLNILEQVKKKIPLSKGDEDNYRLMTSKLDDLNLEELLELIWNTAKDKHINKKYDSTQDNYTFTSGEVYVGPMINYRYHEILENAFKNIKPNKNYVVNGTTHKIFYVSDNFKVSKVSEISTLFWVITKSNRSFLKEQVIKKIPISAIENLQRRVMQNNISLDELVEKVYKIKTMSIESSKKYNPSAPIQIYNSNTGIDHVLFRLLLKNMSQTSSADVETKKNSMTIKHNLDNFVLTYVRNLPGPGPYYPNNYFTIEKK